MAKKNTTLQYFDKTRPNDGTYSIPGPRGIPERRQPIMRLGWRQESNRVSWELIAESIENSALPNAVFFMDSSFFDRHEIPWAVWAALRKRRIAFTPLVWQELQDWIENPFANARIRDDLVNSKAAGDTRFLFLDTSVWQNDVRRNSHRYIEMLASRKWIGRAMAAEYEERHGSPPSPEELNRIIQRRVRDRGLILARKGIKDFEKSNFLADEELIVTAVVHSIITGEESTVLTRDVDLLEQFYKAIYLLDTDYRSKLIFDSYSLSPDNVITCAPPLESIADLVESEDCVLLDLPNRFEDWVLPANQNWVVVSCMRLGGQDENMRMSRMSFCAEKEMIRALGHNHETTPQCRLCVSPPFPTSFGGKALISKEKKVEFGSIEHSLIDLNYAIQEVEHFRRFSVDLDMPEDTDRIGLNLAAFRLEERLAFSKEPEWQPISAADAALAIQYLNPATMIFADDSFLRSEVCRRVSGEMIDRRFGLTTNLFDVVSNDLDSCGNEMSAALRKGDKLINVLDVNSDLSHGRGLGYYLALLAFRRLFGRVIKERVLRDYGRISPDTEWPQIVEHYSGIRGRLLAESASKRENDCSLFYRDELVVQAFIEAVFHGSDAVILTSDPFVMDQFVELCRHVGDDYVACELWYRMLADPNKYPTYTVTSKDNSQSIQCHDLAPGWKENVLPANPYFVNVHCWLFNGDDSNPMICPFTFCAERPMHRVLTIKGKHGGPNIDDSLGRNLRIGSMASGAPIALIDDDDSVEIGSASFPSDKRLKLRHRSIPALDLTHLANQKEWISPVWLDALDQSDGA